MKALGSSETLFTARSEGVSITSVCWRDLAALNSGNWLGYQGRGVKRFKSTELIKELDLPNGRVTSGEHNPFAYGQLIGSAYGALEGQKAGEYCICHNIFSAFE